MRPLALKNLFYAMQPTLAATNGRLVLLSSPAGKRGYLYEQWISAEGDWKKFMVRSDECERITETDFLGRERKSMPNYYFRSEYLCAFGDTRWISRLSSVCFDKRT